MGNKNGTRAMTMTRAFLGFLTAALLFFPLSREAQADSLEAQADSGRETAVSLQNNVVLIRVDFPNKLPDTGYGVIFAEDKGTLLIVTANHVVRPKSNAPEEIPPVIMVRIPCISGDPWQVAQRKPEAHTEDFDLAVIETSAAGCTWERKALAPITTGLARANTWFIGRGDEQYFIPMISGKMNSNEPDEHFALRAEVQDALPGNSGGPLLTQDGIIGIIFDGGEARNGNLISARSIDRVQKFVQSNWHLQWQLETRAPVDAELASLRKAWSVVLQEALVGIPARALLALGQYGAEKSFAPLPNGGLRIGGGHSYSVAWWNVPLAPPFLMSTELKVERKDILQPALWLLGPGYGVNPESSYVLTIENAQRVTLSSEGVVRSPAQVFLDKALEVDQWYPVDLLVDKDRVKFFLQGKAIAEWPVSSLPSGPLHSFIGLGALRGVTYEPSAAVFRRLEIRSPRVSGSLQLDPPAFPESELFVPCEKPSVNLDFTGTLQPTHWTTIRDPSATALTSAGLLLKAGNETPSVWLEPTRADDFAAEYLVQFIPGADSVNLRFLINVGESGPTEKDVFDGWILAFPRGEGGIELRQIETARGGENFWGSYEQAQVLAHFAFFSPINGRDYRIRFERFQGKLRVLSNGGLLFDVADPWAKNDSKKKHVQLGLTKIFGGVLLKQVLMWTRCPLPATSVAPMNGPP